MTNKQKEENSCLFDDRHNFTPRYSETPNPNTSSIAFAIETCYSHEEVTKATLAATLKLQVYEGDRCTKCGLWLDKGKNLTQE